MLFRDSIDSNVAERLLIALLDEIQSNQPTKLNHLGLGEVHESNGIIWTLSNRLCKTTHPWIDLDAIGLQAGSMVENVVGGTHTIRLLYLHSAQLTFFHTLSHL